MHGHLISVEFERAANAGTSNKKLATFYLVFKSFQISDGDTSMTMDQYTGNQNHILHRILKQGDITHRQNNTNMIHAPTGLE